MIYNNVEKTLWSHGNRSGSIEDPFYIAWIEGGNPVEDYPLGDAKVVAINLINVLRDAKKSLPILSEGYEVQTGPLNVGALATDMFAASKNKRVILSITSSGNVATIEFQKNHHLKDGVSFPVSGLDQAAYNITAIVSVVDKKTVTYPISGPAVSPATGTPDAGASTFKWVDDNNDFVFWTPDQAEEIIQACAEYLDECILHGVDLKNEIRSCETIDEIDAIDITAGWPSTGM